MNNNFIPDVSNSDIYKPDYQSYTSYNQQGWYVFCYLEYYNTYTGYNQQG